MTHAPSPVSDAESHRAALWGIAYRMTGTVQDADDVVQDAFLRLVERPPRDLDRPLRGWLVAVTLNLARDRLRERRRRTYLGPWLPAPVPDSRLAEDSIALRESATWAFLVAAEALTPTQRAVFLAREVLELTSAETAEILGTSAGSVDVMLHRARAALGTLPARRRVVDDALVVAFLGFLQLGMTAAAVKLLHPDAVALNDGGGRVHAARQPVRGARKIVTFLRRLARQYPGGLRWRIARCNGLVTLIGEHVDPNPHGRTPSRFTLAAEVVDGQIARFYSQLVPEKLAAV